MKIIIANTNVQALLKTTDKILEQYSKDDVPENIKGQATLSALKNEFGGRFFDICKVDQLIKMNEVYIPSEKYEFLRTLHCVDWADMTKETREYVWATLVDLFRTNIVMANSNYEMDY